MADLARKFIREPDTETPAAYARRVRWLAVIHASLPLLAVAGIALLLGWGKHFVTLAQRSNVETLTLAFIGLFMAYVLTLAAPGFAGAVRIVRHSLGGDALERERRKERALGPPGGEPPQVGLNVVLEQEDRPGEAFEVRLFDAAGSMGTLRIDGARVSHREARRDGSQNVFPFFARQVARLVKKRGIERDIDVVQWKAIDDEEAEEYLGLVEFARNLSRELGKKPLWPTVRLTAGEIAELERLLSEICPALRNEAFLPHWEYAAEHKLPIIPEPLGIISLGRSERRADPLASMGCATLVVASFVAILVLFIVLPPWVPGK